MGELEPWIDESFVRSVWFGLGEQVNVKMIRDKFSGYVSNALSTLEIRELSRRAVTPDTALSISPVLRLQRKR